jgi:hypothetical protein
MDEYAANASPEAVVVNLDTRVFGEREFMCAMVTLRANAGDGERRLCRVEHAGATEVDCQVFLEIVQNHLEDAAQILPLADRARCVIEKMQARELRSEFLVAAFEIVEIGVGAEPFQNAPFGVA